MIGEAHHYAHADLLWYARTPRSAKHRLIERHLKDCASCRESTALMKE